MAKNRAKLTRRKTVGVKIQADTATEETLAGADYLEAFDPSIKFDNTFNKRPGVGLGNRKGVAGAQTGEVSLKTELRNSGSATLPLSATLLTAAGFKNTAGVFSLQGVADVGDVATVGLFQDGEFKSLAGVMFDVKFTGEVGKPVVVEWTGKGKRSTGVAGPRDLTPITATPMSGTPPVVKGITLTVGGVAYCIEKFEIMMGNKVVLRPCVTDATGYYAAQIVERQITITMDPERKSITTKDFYNDYEVGTEAALSIVIGTGANGTVTIAAGKIQLQQPVEDADGDGIARYALSFQANETAGDDEITVTYA